MSRSLKVAKEYLEKVKFALLRNSFPSQRALAIDLGMALSTVSRFCTGKPVDYSTFVDISDTLGLEWKDIVELNHTIASSVKTKSNSITLKLSSDRQQSLELKTATDNNTEAVSIPNDLPFPEASVPANSPLYQARDNIESICYKTIIKLIQI